MASNGESKQHTSGPEPLKIHVKIDQSPTNMLCVKKRGMTWRISTYLNIKHCHLNWSLKLACHRLQQKGTQLRGVSMCYGTMAVKTTNCDAHQRWSKYSARFPPLDMVPLEIGPRTQPFLMNLPFSRPSHQPWWVAVPVTCRVGRRFDSQFQEAKHVATLFKPRRCRRFIL